MKHRVIIAKSVAAALLGLTILVGVATAATAAPSVIGNGAYQPDPSDQITQMWAPNGSNGGGFVLHYNDPRGVTFTGVYLRNVRGTGAVSLQASFCTAARNDCTTWRTINSTTGTNRVFEPYTLTTGRNPTYWVATRICDEGSCSPLQWEMRGGG